jgi:hypothetical protein
MKDIACNVLLLCVLSSLWKEVREFIYYFDFSIVYPMHSGHMKVD